jgi:hypothetical protein
MVDREVIWLPRVRRKLVQFRSEHFTREETLDFISQLILETEDFLSNPVLSRTYLEEIGQYKGLSRVLIKKFRVYFLNKNGQITIVAILFPGEK